MESITGINQTARVGGWPLLSFQPFKDCKYQDMMSLGHQRKSLLGHCLDVEFKHNIDGYEIRLNYHMKAVFENPNVEFWPWS